MEFGQSRTSHSCKKKKEKRKKDEYDKKNKTKDEKLTYPLDKDDPFHQYKEEMDPFLLQ